MEFLAEGCTAHARWPPTERFFCGEVWTATLRASHVRLPVVSVCSSLVQLIVCFRLQVPERTLPGGEEQTARNDECPSAWVAPPPTRGWRARRWPFPRAPAQLALPLSSSLPRRPLGPHPTVMVGGAHSAYPGVSAAAASGAPAGRPPWGKTWPPIFCTGMVMIGHPRLFSRDDCGTRRHVGGGRTPKPAQSPPRAVRPAHTSRHRAAASRAGGGPAPSFQSGQPSSGGDIARRLSLRGGIWALPTVRCLRGGSSALTRDPAGCKQDVATGCHACHPHKPPETACPLKRPARREGAGPSGGRWPRAAPLRRGVGGPTGWC